MIITYYYYFYGGSIPTGGALEVWPCDFGPKQSGWLINQLGEPNFNFNPQQRIAAFDRRYMPDGMPAPETSVQGNAEDHRSELKRKADGISRSLSDVFAYLTYNTTSQNEAKKLLTIIHNVCKIIIISILCKIINIDIISIIHVISIMTIICFQLHYRPADIPHSTLRTMAKDVRRAMLPNNDEVLKKSFAEGIEDAHHLHVHMMISRRVLSSFGRESSP